MRSITLLIVVLALTPIYAGLILKVKAFFGGKKGPPILIHYYTLIKLFQKTSVYSHSITFVFKLSPVIAFSTGLIALLFFPVSGEHSLVHFQGDVILVLYLFGVSRFFTIIAALDTGSPFEGMGAAREAYFSIFAEATIFMSLILFCLLTGELSVSSLFSKSGVIHMWQAAGPAMILVLVALYIVLLTENTRVPVDDPATHLELTMIHEVMILDHSGPDLAFIEMGSQLKLMFYSCIIAQLVFPFDLKNVYVNSIAFCLILIAIYLSVGITESLIARFKLIKVPKFILISFVLVVFATIITLEFPL